jgi:hypothetical protein
MIIRSRRVVKARGGKDLHPNSLSFLFITLITIVQFFDLFLIISFPPRPPFSKSSFPLSSLMSPLSLTYKVEKKRKNGNMKERGLISWVIKGAGEVDT